MVETGLAQLKIIWCSWLDWFTQQTTQINFNTEYGPAGDRYQLENLAPVMCEDSHYIAAFGVKNKVAVAETKTNYGSIWDPNNFIEHSDSDTEAYCRCASAD